MPAGTLTATVDVYNRHAADGTDPLFHKAKQWLQPLIEPPFVALDCRIDYAFYPHFTLGGADTLPTGQVVDATRMPVPGLYAAGRTTCGLPRWGAGYSSGLSLADATFFGRQAGRHAAQAGATQCAAPLSVFRREMNDARAITSPGASSFQAAKQPSNQPVRPVDP